MYGWVDHVGVRLLGGDTSRTWGFYLFEWMISVWMDG